MGGRETRVHTWYQCLLAAEHEAKSQEGFRPIWQTDLEIRKKSKGSGLAETTGKGTAKVRGLYCKISD